MALINCSECKHQISDQAEICPHCGVNVVKKGKKSKQSKTDTQAITQIQVQPHYNIEVKKEKDKKVPMSILISITFILLSASCLIAFLVEMGPTKLEHTFDKSGCTPYYCEISKKGTYLEIDTNPENTLNFSSQEAFEIIKKVNEILQLPESLSKKIDSTTAIDGRQVYNFENVSVSWIFHPEQGYEVIYEVIE